MKIFKEIKESLIILAFLFGISFTAFSQVGINTESPNSLTELDIRNKVVGNDTIPKGVMVPRMTQKQRDAIVVTDKTLADGLFIYNINEDCYNYYSKAEAEWKSLCGKLGKAVFTAPDCGSIKIGGFSYSAVSMGTENVVTIKVNVTKTGTYTVSATPNPANGYYYSASGEFQATGDYVLRLQGSGTPTRPTTGLGEKIDVMLNGVLSACDTIKNQVKDSSKKPYYTLDCSKTVVGGVYVQNKALDPAKNTLTLTLTVDPAANGGFYSIKTNVVDGISFSGSGLLVQGTQTVVLQGSGTPTSTDTKRLTISTNSETSVTTCPVSVEVAFSKKKILTLGYSADLYGYNLSAGSSSTGVYSYGGRKMLLSPYNFGTDLTSTVKAEGFDIIDGGNDGANPTLLQTNINTYKPDIIVVAYSVIPNNAFIDILLAYTEKKGVVIAFTEAQTSVAYLFNRALSKTTITAGGAGGGGSVYTFENVLGSTILNGPFGDLRGKTWGEDASTTAAITGAPTDRLDVFSTGSRAGVPQASVVTACKFKDYNMVWVGDGGFYSRGYDAGIVAATGVCPLYYDANFQPALGLYGAPAVNVSNSFFFANVMAWAVKTAQTNGYNSK